MAEVEKNREVWEGWDWSRSGDEWSESWGGTEALWHGALLPRIHPFVPTGRILEIAPGYGRWTQYLKDLCDHLSVVDLTERCIAHCRERFADATHIDYHVNDGRSLDMIEDRSVDFAFSYDSLVHVEADVMCAYLEQLASKLCRNGVGFIHHSNIRDYALVSALSKRLPARLAKALVTRGALVDLGAWRAESMSAEIFAAQCDRAGLACISQEKISWERGPYLIDAISVFTPKGSTRARPRRIVRNPLFGLEAKRMAKLYAVNRLSELGSADPRSRGRSR